LNEHNYAGTYLNIQSNINVTSAEKNLVDLFPYTRMGSFRVQTITLLDIEVGSKRN